MTATAIKLIAIISMLIDHIGAVFFPQIPLFRAIGRIAFPIFCFMIAQGFIYTRSRKKYFFRLALFALLSEIPFDLLFNNSIIDFSYQNVFFTLSLGLAAIYLIDYFERKGGYSIILGYVCAVLLAILAIIMKTDYDAYGVIVIVLFYCFRNSRFAMSIMYTLIAAVHSLYICRYPLLLFQLAALLPINLYNGKKGASSKLIKYSFYLFYPVHLIVLYAIRYLIK